MDKKLSALLKRALDHNIHGHILNMLERADSYNGVLAAAVEAGSLSELARQTGVSPQAVQQWAAQGFVPLNRIAEIESLYGIPRAELMNPKYARALEPISFSDEDVEERRVASARRKTVARLNRKPRSVPVLDEENFDASDV